LRRKAGEGKGSLGGRGLLCWSSRRLGLSLAGIRIIIRIIIIIVIVVVVVVDIARRSPASQHLT
jgi:hypothetical protein